MNEDVENISFENVKTNEKLVLKKMDYGDQNLLIARYPLNAAQSWIESNENEICEWDNAKLDRKICMDNELGSEI
jgi:ABC-type proline/glycine betaine transport system substrate-binding protein